MPRSAPTVPAKPSSLRTVSAMPSSPRSNRVVKMPAGNRAGNRSSLREGLCGDNDEEGEGDETGDAKEEGGDDNDDEKKDGDSDNDNSNDEEGQGDGPNQEEDSDEAKAKEKARRKARRHPQKNINKLWKNFEPFYLGRVTKILPDSVPDSTTPKGKAQTSRNAVQSYEEARAQCERDVKRIIRECRALNQKYTDAHFDLERDLKLTQKRDCLDGLVMDDEDDRYEPEDVKRVTDIFTDPTFYSEGADSDDIMQGAIGDCWMMSAFSVLTCKEELIHKICVIQDQDVGVYGFVFFRDGEWHQTIIDDKLYLDRGAFDEGLETYLSNWGKDQDKKYKELFQQGSKALYFARCRDENETWVPLLEKALAKAHGGYDALSGGQTGEALEDLTGGVTTEIYTTNILSKKKFWEEELTQIGKMFMFDASEAAYREWRGWDQDNNWIKKVREKARKGVVGGHAYAVLGTYEGYGVKLVKVRNPWGQSEWNGAWSDGSSEWTAEWLQRVGHKFGDDGIFWMSYEDFLNNYKHLNRTRIFDDSWYTAQKWATIQVPFSNLDYQQTRFEVNVPEDTPTVFVLSQLDYRYFQGLQGKYRFRLHFRVSSADDEDEYICRSKQNYEMTRSTNVELDLEKGKYIIRIKVEAVDLSPIGGKTPDEVIKDNLPWRKDKVITIGRLYDLAHRKGLPEAEDEVAETTDSATQTTDGSTGTDSDVVTPAIGTTSTDKEGGMSPEAMASIIAAAISSDTEPGSDSDDEDSDDEDEKQPWNASCVLGLRVYSKLPDLSVRVILPPKAKAKETPVVVLDRDDITKAAQEEAEEDNEEEDETVKSEEDKPKTKEKSGDSSKDSKGKKAQSATATSKLKGGLSSRGKPKPEPVQQEEEEEEEDDEGSE